MENCAAFIFPFDRKLLTVEHLFNRIWREHEQFFHMLCHACATYICNLYILFLSSIRMSYYQIRIIFFPKMLMFILSGTYNV